MPRPARRSGRPRGPARGPARRRRGTAGRDRRRPPSPGGGPTARRRRRRRGPARRRRGPGCRCPAPHRTRPPGTRPRGARTGTGSGCEIASRGPCPESPPAWNPLAARAGAAYGAAVPPTDVPPTDVPSTDVPSTDQRFATVGDVRLCCDTFGNLADPTLLLVMGMGFQLVHWPEGFCRMLAAEGFLVVRFDNRDAGCSTHLPGRRYTLEDMADDATGLLDALGVGSAHVVGASLGGMIAQTMAIRHPERVRSLASLMSTTGRRGAGRGWR